MLEDTGFAGQIQRAMSFEFTRLQIIFKNCFYINQNGERILKDDVTTEQLNLIKQSFNKVLAIYKEQLEEIKTINAEKEIHAIEVDNTKKLLTNLSNKYNIKIPETFRVLYNM